MEAMATSVVALPHRISRFLTNGATIRLLIVGTGRSEITLGWSPVSAPQRVLSLVFWAALSLVLSGRLR